LARARDARKREARAQDKRKEEWQAATKSTNLMGVLGASSFGLAKAGELSGTILTEISATRDKAMARVQEMSQAADAPKALSAIAEEHFSGASKHARSEQSKVDEHYRRLRILAKFTLLAFIVFFIFSGVRSAYHDALALVSPAAKELDRLKEETKTPFVVESYDTALSVDDAQNNTESTDNAEVRLPSPSVRALSPVDARQVSPRPLLTYILSRHAGKSLCIGELSGVAVLQRKGQDPQDRLLRSGELQEAMFPVIAYATSAMLALG
jgi:hypothetical protein